MNCPGHICIYQSQPRSYRDLPIRYAEFGTVYRYERSGVLHGMLRVRGFTQDDAHVFCTPEQVPDGDRAAARPRATRCSATFGYPYTIELATRPEKALGHGRAVAERARRRWRTCSSKRGQEFTYRRGRRRVLRAEARLQADRRDRAKVAGPDRAARLQSSRAVRSRVHGRGQRAAPADRCCTACSSGRWSGSSAD